MQHAKLTFLSNFVGRNFILIITRRALCLRFRSNTKREMRPPPFRLDVQLHDLLTKAPSPRPLLLPSTGDGKFPEPVFPQYPDLLAQDDNYEAESRTSQGREAALDSALWFIAP